MPQSTESTVSKYRKCKYIKEHAIVLLQPTIKLSHTIFTTRCLLPGCLLDLILHWFIIC